MVSRRSQFNSSDGQDLPLTTQKTVWTETEGCFRFHSQYRVLKFCLLGWRACLQIVPWQAEVPTATLHRAVSRSTVIQKLLELPPRILMGMSLNWSLDRQCCSWTVAKRDWNWVTHCFRVHSQNCFIRSATWVPWQMMQVSRGNPKSL